MTSPLGRVLFGKVAGGALVKLANFRQVIGAEVRAFVAEVVA